MKPKNLIDRIGELKKDILLCHVHYCKNGSCTVCHDLKVRINELKFVKSLIQDKMGENVRDIKRLWVEIDRCVVFNQSGEMERLVKQRYILKLENKTLNSLLGVDCPSDTTKSSDLVTEEDYDGQVEYMYLGPDK